MKKYIFLALALLLALPAFAVDSTLQGLDLTDKQIAQSDSLKSDVVNGFAVWPQEHKVVVVSNRDLTSQEIAMLRTELVALPDEDTQDVIAAKAQAEVDALIDQKKTEIAIAELKKEGKLDQAGNIVEAKEL